MSLIFRNALSTEKTEKVLIILDSPSDVIKKSINNIEKVKLIAADQLNVFDILNANKLVIFEVFEYRNKTRNSTFSRIFKHLINTLKNYIMRFVIEITK